MCGSDHSSGPHSKMPRRWWRNAMQGLNYLQIPLSEGWLLMWASWLRRLASIKNNSTDARLEGPFGTLNCFALGGCFFGNGFRIGWISSALMLALSLILQLLVRQWTTGGWDKGSERQGSQSPQWSCGLWSFLVAKKHFQGSNKSIRETEQKVTHVHSL